MSKVQARQAGFTVLEILVALAIFSLAALALLRVQAISLRTAADLDARQMAQIVAANRGVELLTDPAPPPLGVREGEMVNGGRRWRWRQTARREAGSALLMLRVEVEEDAPGPGRARAVLDFVRAGA